MTFSVIKSQGFASLRMNKLDAALADVNLLLPLLVRGHSSCDVSCCYLEQDSGAAGRHAPTS